MTFDWNTMSLGDLCDFRAGSVFKPVLQGQTSGDFPFVKVSDMNLPVNAVRIQDANNWVSAADLRELRAKPFPPGTVVFAKIGEALRQNRLRQVARETIVDNNMMGAIPRTDRVDPCYFYYALSQFDFSEIAQGTALPYLTVGSLSALTLDVPPLPEQRAIAHILGTLDDKIENLRRQNETLEAMARALFQAWFVDFEPVRAKIEGRWRRGESLPGLPAHLYDLFPDRLVESELGEIPEGWDVGTLGRFFEIGLGGVWGNDEATARASIAVHCLRGIDCHDLAEGRVPDVPVRWVSPKQAADRHLSDGTVLIEGSGSFCGRSMIWKRAYGELIGEPVGYSNFCKRLDPICSTSQAIICWMQMRQAYRDGLLQSFQTGTAFPNFDVQGVLATFIVVVPSQPIADVFARMFDISQRINLMAQSRTLANLRDTLLPKLISGELRVKDAEAFLAERGL